MIDEIIKEVQEKQKEINSLKKELLKKSEEAFFKGAKQIFETCPQLDSVSWTQYTPFFNDGDTCEFSVNTGYLEVNGKYTDEDDSLSPTVIKSRGTYNRNLGVYEGRVEEPNPNYNKTLSDSVDMMSKFLEVFDEDFYKSQFGDHVKVTITKEGIDTEEYDHE
jgi:hypothetical protein